MSLMRSERMGYYHIVMSRENAWEIMNELGELSAVEFVDLNQNEQVLTRPYSTYIKRCEEIELKIQSMEQTMLKFNRPIERCTEYKAFLKSQRDILKQRNKAEHTYLEEIEAEVDERLTTLNNQLKYYDSAVDDYNKVIENLYVLEEARIYFSHENSGGHAHDEESKGSFEASHGLIKFDYLAGVIDRSDSQRFRRVLHRTLHGMVWTTLIDIETDRHESKRSLEKEFAMESKSENKKRTVFLIAYPRGESNIVKEKLHKITDSFGANKYGIPTDKPSFESRIAELQTQRREKFKILGVTREHIELQLESLLLPNLQNETWPAIENYRLFVLKEKTTYHNLNKLKEQHSILQGALWCPTLLEDEVRKTLDDLANSKPHITKPEFSFAEKPERVQPPTYFRTNDFSAPFQEIVNTYGVPRYREVNPGLFTIASFPFLFGVMFGDIGHGLIIFVFGLFLCFKNSEILREKGPLAGLLSARYLLAMMGFFALYCGLIYNDFMALPLDIFGSCYEENGEGEARTRKDDRCVYSFGLDPVWYDASNELTFFNSFKMKMAIILGVSQMMLGTMLKMVNAIHFRSALDFFFEWMPQIVFLSCTFGYMVVLIFIKWATPYGVSIPTSEAPAIINIFINFALKAGKFDVGTEKAPIRPLYGELDGSTQSKVQQALLIISMVCVPLMLLPKPLILSAMHKKAPSKKEYEPIVEEEKASLIHGKDVIITSFYILYLNTFYFHLYRKKLIQEVSQCSQ